MGDFPHVKVEGDPVGGWIVDVHDGQNWGVYFPAAPDAATAEADAIAQHNAKYGTEPITETPTGALTEPPLPPPPDNPG